MSSSASSETARLDRVDHKERAHDYLDTLLSHSLREGWTGTASLVLMIHEGNLRGVHLTTDRKMP